MIHTKKLKHVILALSGVLLLQSHSFGKPKEMASFRKLFRGPGELSSEIAKDNIRECAPTVRRSLKRIKSDWGRFHYTCINGVVRNVFVQTSSPINKQPEIFIGENLGIFDLVGASVTVRFDGDKGAQFYKNDPIREALIFRVLKDGAIPTPNKPNQVKPISTEDLERVAGTEKKDQYAAFEFGLTDPADEKVRIDPAPVSP
ncbi:MAG: hypothetical protein NDJ72_05305 [Elusimicrobia bacterium]|nr:hypothetical protein [Elusimicrobiota bacterium]